MKEFFLFQNRLIEATKFTFRRNRIDSMPWSERLLGISGARGVGKTSMMLQHLLESPLSSAEKLYVSVDNPYIPYSSLIELASIFYSQGGKLLMLDEIHKYPNWSQELKTIYDTLPALNVVFSGSTIIRLMDGEADLSRRALMTRLDGLSFREYLQILLDIELPILSLNDILNNHIDISHELCARFRPLQYFGEYLKSGYYPYSLQSKDTYLLKLASVIGFVIDTEMNVLSPLDARGMHKMRRLLKLISTGLPYVPNISQLSAALELNRITILNYLSLLEKTELTNNVYASGSFYGQLTKPGKVLLANTNLAYALSNDQVNSGAIRETFVVNQLRSSHIVELAGKADFKVDEQFVLEVGGRSKSKKQIAGVSNAFLVTDDREYGFNNQIPLWLFGFLY